VGASPNIDGSADEEDEEVESRDNVVSEARTVEGSKEDEEVIDKDEEVIGEEGMEELDVDDDPDDPVTTPVGFAHKCFSIHA